METLGAMAVETFKKEFGSSPDVIARAPGRVNIIGEHTDYNGGFVLPVAINRDIVIATSKTGGSNIRGFSSTYNEHAECTLGSYNKSHPSGWFRYILGVLNELSLDGIALDGFSFVVAGDIPVGSGLSSSAALETATLTACESLFSFKLEDLDAALLCQTAENDFVGMKCGIMDQYVSRMGLAGHALLIDCSDLTSQEIPVNLPGTRWLVIDSGKRRGLVDSEYNRRRRECEEALDIAQEELPEGEIETLQDVAPDDLLAIKHALRPVVYKRLRHVVTENERVLKTVDALEDNDPETIGEMLFESHDSLRDDFEVSCDELNRLVDILGEQDGVFGARLTGAGFGGCAIALADEKDIESIKTAVAEEYHPESLGRTLEAAVWEINASDGAQIIS